MKKSEFKKLIQEALTESLPQEGILKYNLNDYHSKLAFKRALNSTEAYIALSEIHRQVFRPAFKHGYGGKIDKLIDECPEHLDEDGYSSNVGLKIVEELSNMFQDILDKYDINLNDLE